MDSNKRSQIETLLEELSYNELLELIEQIVRRLRQREARKSQALHGIWKGKFPEDVDIDKALKEIRMHWLEDFKELKQ